LQADWLREFDPIIAFKCEPSRRVSIMHWHGLLDYKVHVSGLLYLILHARSVNVTLESWSQRNGCDWGQQTTTYASGNVTCSGPACSGLASNITLCLVDGMGHKVFPGVEYHIWDFFRSQFRS
jgi:poly(3-hydroxybutyrate) depolymerase